MKMKKMEYVQYTSELVSYVPLHKLYDMFQDDTITSTVTTSAASENITADPKGIPGWDKVGQLAEELVSLTGIAVSAAQAEKIKALCNALDEYDKRAIEVHLRSQQPRLRGHFCSRKGTGHTTIEQMRR